MHIYIWLYLVLVVACGIFSCSMQDLLPWPWIEPKAPDLGAQNLSHWTTKEVPGTDRLFGHQTKILTLIGGILSQYNLETAFL